MESDHCAKSQPDEFVLIENFSEDWLTLPGWEGLMLRPNASTQVSSESSAVASAISLSTNNDPGDTLPRLCHIYGNVQSEINSSTIAESNSAASVQNSPTLRVQAPQGLRHGIASRTREKRKGHTKSRLGCINCKARKVKCQETWPSCANCLKRGSTCKYPIVFKQVQHERIVSEMAASPSQSIQLQSTPTFTMSDMRLFHHFLVSAHPYLPVNHEQVWVRDIPAFAHQYDYLMHAMLALSASHLSLLCAESFSTAYLSHRQQAIRGLQNAFSSWPLKPTEAHAMLATSYVLAFQSQYMEDGLVDHVLFIRGCVLLSQIILRNNLEGSFTIYPNMLCTTVNKGLDDVSAIDIRLVYDALESLKRLTPLVENSSAHEVEISLHSILVATTKPLLAPDAASASSESASSPFKFPHTPSFKSESNPNPTSLLLGTPMYETSYPSTFQDDSTPQFALSSSSHQAYFHLMRIFPAFAAWPDASMTHLLSESNPLSRALLAHCIAVQLVLVPLRMHEGGLEAPFWVMPLWVEKIYEGLKVEERKGNGKGIPWTKLVKWPLRVVRAMMAMVEGKDRLTKGKLVDIVLKHPEKLAYSICETTASTVNPEDG
ncbi:hypothetical protein AOQ84DRAFT_383744 [Glonium stellatum]|uniref:Zn(2)-C6 fungal-type domain-containing protein n=1 Tax=Glonium stellatum TaxID=574774 RepID=A0A8E2EMV4_9PEZI|nr:hypothetical protein AOQ84DRAFT_383744 [Glonium stellatum]